MPTPLDRYCVMGNPVAHSKSPWIHARFAQLTGQAMEYDRRLIALDGFAAGVRAFREEGGRGCNITVPFKFQAAELPAIEGLGPLRRTARAELAGACNVLRFDEGAVFADNTDGVGLARDIERNAGRPLQGLRVLLVGAGGAAAGVTGPLIAGRPALLAIANRTAPKAQALVARHAALAAAQQVQLAAVPLADPGQGFDVVINATASSLAGEAAPVPASALRPGALACDMMYGPAAGGFMDWASRHGATPRDGLGMLVEQAAEAFELFRGVFPPSAQVLAELRELMDRQDA